MTSKESTLIQPNATKLDNQYFRDGNFQTIKSISVESFCVLRKTHTLTVNGLWNIN